MPTLAAREGVRFTAQPSKRPLVLALVGSFRSTVVEMTDARITAPGEDDRLSILKVHSRGRPFSADVDWQALARRTEGFSGAELERLLREATMCAVRELVAANVEHAAAVLEVQPRHITHACGANSRPV